MGAKSIDQFTGVTTIQSGDTYHVGRLDDDYKITGKYLFREFRPYYEYTALISQSAPGNITSGTLQLGANYLVTNYNAGDDFSNMQTISGTTNTTGFYFRATADTASNFSNGSTLNYDGSPYVVSKDSNGLVNPMVNTFEIPITYSYVSTGVFKISIAYDVNQLYYEIGNAETYPMGGANIYGMFLLDNISNSYFTLQTIGEIGGTFANFNGYLRNTFLHFRGY